MINVEVERDGGRRLAVIDLSQSSVTPAVALRELRRALSWVTQKNSGTIPTKDGFIFVDLEGRTPNDSILKKRLLQRIQALEEAIDQTPPAQDPPPKRPEDASGWTPSPPWPPEGADNAGSNGEGSGPGQPSESEPVNIEELHQGLVTALRHRFVSMIEDGLRVILGGVPDILSVQVTVKVASRKKDKTDE